MKKYLFLLAAVVAFAACSKELAPATIEEPKNDVATTDNVVTLFAEIPAMEDGTKAIADGTFAWAVNDEIAIPISGGYAIFKYDGSSFKYTLTGSETFEDGTAYYPASSRPYGDYSTSFANADVARAGFKMTAPYTVGASSITFTHESSLIKLNFSNVPSFATSVRVKEGETVVATVALSNPSSSLEVKVPVTPNGSKTYSFALMENSNVIKEVSKSSVSLTAGKFYTTPEIAIGPVILIKNNVNYEMSTVAGKSWESITKTSGEICFYAKKGDDEYCSWSTSSSNLTPITISAEDYGYFVFPATAAGETVTIEICNKDNGNGYPKSVRSVTLASGTSFYDFAYGTGLKASSENFCYIFAEDYEKEGAFIYAWNTDSSEPFGNYTACTKEANYTGKTTMWENGRVIRFLPKSTLSSTSKVKTVRAGDTSWVFKDNAEIGSDAVDGQYYLGTYNHESGGNWYSGVYTNTYAEYLTKGVWK